jgi:hypothetical protein
MFHRLFVPQGILLACLITAFAFSMKLLGREGAATAPVEIPAIVTSDYLLFAQLNVKEIRESALFTEVKEAFAKSGGKAEWDNFVEFLNKDFSPGISVTDLDMATFCITELPDRGGPISVLILTSSKAINREGAFGLKSGAKPDANGFYERTPEMLVHFPNEKTMAVLHPKLAQKYLDGYAMNPAGWPFTAQLSKAAAGQTFFATLRPDKLPANSMKGHPFFQFGPLFAARGVTLTAKLEGKELSIAGRASFADATAAGKASHKVHTLIGVVADSIDSLLVDKSTSQLSTILPALKEAERALAEARVEVVGSEVISTGVYSANFKIEPMVAGVVKFMRVNLPRIEASNNLKQIGLALANFANANNDVLFIHGMAANGAPLAKANEKPLLSWRVGLLPYMEQNDLYKQFKLDEPWDSETNKKLIEKMPKIYAPIGKAGKPGYTHLQMVIGPSAMRPGLYTMGTVPDGTSNTIAVLEAAEPVIWTKPDDVMFPANDLPKDFRKKFGSQFPDGFHVLMWDGSVRFVPNSVTDRTLGFAICPDDGNVLGADW